MLGAPEAAVREAVEWGKVVKVVVHLVVAVRRRSLHLLRQFSQKPRRQHQFMLRAARLTLPGSEA